MRRHSIMLIENYSEIASNVLECLGKTMVVQRAAPGSSSFLNRQMLEISPDLILIGESVMDADFAHELEIFDSKYTNCPILIADLALIPLREYTNKNKTPFFRSHISRAQDLHSLIKLAIAQHETEIKIARRNHVIADLKKELEVQIYKNVDFERRFTSMQWSLLNLGKNTVDIFLLGRMNSKGGFKIIYANEAFERFWRCDVRDAYADNEVFFQRIAKSERQQIRDVICTAPEGEHDIDTMITLDYKDNSTLQLSLRGKIIEHRGKHDRDFLLVARKKSDANMPKDAMRMADECKSTLLKDVPVPICEADGHRLKKYIDELIKQGVVDLKAYFEQNPVEILKCYSMITIVDVNPAALSMLQFNSRKDLLVHIDKISSRSLIDAYRDTIINFFDENYSYSQAVVLHTAKQKKIEGVLRISMSPACADQWTPIYISFIDIAEKHLSKQTPIQSDAHFRSLIEHSFLSIVLFNADGSIRHLNRATMELYSFTKQDWQERFKFFNVLTDPQAVHAGIADILRRVANGETMMIPAYLYSPANSDCIQNPVGPERWIEGFSSPVLDHNGEVESMMLVQFDVSARINMEKANTHNEARFRLAAQHTNDLIYEWNFVTNQMVLYGDTQHTLGLSIAEAPKNIDEWIALIHPDDRPRVHAMMLKYKQDWQQHTLEYRIRHADGGWRIWLDRGHVLLSSKMQGQTVVGGCTDITQQRTDELELRKLSSALKQSPVGAIITDAMGKIEYANPCYCQQAGIPVDEIVGEMLPILNREKTGTFLGDDIWKVLREGQSWHGEYQGHRKNGAVFFEDVMISSIRGQHGEIKNLVSINRDITSRIKFELEKEKVEAQMRQMRELEITTMLAGSFAHDFNNILTPILGYADMVFTKLPENSMLRDDQQKVIKSTLRAKEMIEQVLLHTNQEKVPRYALTLQPIINETIRVLRPALPENITLSKDIQDVCEPVNINPNQIYKILMNLCNNACHAMQENGGQLHIALQNAGITDFADVGELPGVRITVKDSGTGMDEETLEHLFEPFFTTKAVGEGNGLGLSLVKRIVTDYRGKIDVHSVLNQGTSFDVVFPVFSESDSETE